MALTLKRPYLKPTLVSLGASAAPTLLMCTFPLERCPEDGPDSCTLDPVDYCDCPTPGPNCGG